MRGGISKNDYISNAQQSCVSATALTKKEGRRAVQERRSYLTIYIYIYIYTYSRCFKGKANGPLGKTGERPPIFYIGVGMRWLASCVTASKRRRTAPQERRGNARQFLHWGRNALACVVRCCFKEKANCPLGKKGERSPIFTLGWKCTGLRRALQVLVVQWWSFDQAAKINEKSMKNLAKKR